MRLDGGKRVDRAAESVNSAKAANDDNLRLQSANETKMPRGYFTPPGVSGAFWSI